MIFRLPETVSGSLATEFKAMININNRLPERVVAAEYDRFLFFDFCFRSNQRFFNEFQATLKQYGYAELRISAPDNAQSAVSFDAVQQSFDDWAAIADKILAQNGYGCFLVSDSDAGWLAAQWLPTDWGIFAFKSSIKQSNSLFESMNKDWFLTIDDFAAARQDEHSVLRQEFGLPFIEILLDRYGQAA